MSPHLTEVLLMSTYNTFSWRNKKYSIGPNYHTVGFGFSKILRKAVVKYVPKLTILRVHFENDQQSTYQMMLM